MSKFIVATVAALALGIGLTGVAGATEYRRMYCEETKVYCQFKKVVTYKTVIDYKVERQEYVKWVTEYDHCNRPYKVKKVCYRDVKVPCKRQVAVVHWVKVCL